MAADNFLNRIKAAGQLLTTGSTTLLAPTPSAPHSQKLLYGGMPLILTDYHDHDGALYGETHTNIRADKYGAAFIVAHNEAAVRCVSKIANTVGGTPWEIIDTRSDQPVSHSNDRQPAHFMAKVIRDYQNREHEPFFTQWAIGLAVAGENYVELMRSAHWFDHRIAGLQWLNPLAVTKQVLSGKIKEYRYNSGGGEYVTFGANEIAYDRHGYDLRTDIHGHPPLASASITSSIVLNAGRALQAYFGNGSTPGAIVSPREKAVGVTEHDMAMLQRKLHADFKGVDSKYRTLLLHMPVDITTLNEPTLDHWVEIVKKMESEIYTAFGVPRSVAGDSDTQRYQASPDDKERFGYTALEYIDGIEQHFNDVIAPQLDPEGYHILRFDRSAFHTISREAVDIAGARLSGGYSTLNEAREAAGLEAVEGGDVIALPINVTFAEVKQVNGKRVLELPPLVAPIPEPPVAPIVETPVVETPLLPATNEEKGTGVEVFIGLDLANNPDLIGLQGQVKSLAGGAGEWNAPTDFHVTLLYAPNVDADVAEAFMTAAQAITPPELSLRIGSLNSFDTLGVWAVHFQIRTPEVLLDYQEQLYDLAVEHEIPVSSYSVPMNYKPHITMGKTPEKIKQTFRSNLKVTPSRVIYDIDHEPFDDAVPDEAVKQKALDELLTWKRVTKKNPAKAFTFNDIPADIQRMLAKQLKAGVNIDAVYDTAYTLIAQDAPPKVKGAIAAGQYDKLPLLSQTYAKHLKEAQIEDIAPALIRHYVSVTSAKAIQATRIDFEDTVTDLFIDAVDGKVTRQRFGTILRNAIRVNSYKAYADGLADGGVKDAELDDDDIEWLEEHIRDQSAYVTAVAEAIFKDERVSPEEAENNKALMWWNKSISPSYDRGLLSSAENGAFIWVRGRTSDSCADCIALDGIVKRYRDWHKRGLTPPCDKTECGGWMCKCAIRPTDKAVSRARLPRTSGSSKAHTHDHNEEEPAA